jgi:hypothetical protein
MADKQKANDKLAKDIKSTIAKASKQEPIQQPPSEEIPQPEPEQLPETPESEQIPEVPMEPDNIESPEGTGDENQEEDLNDFGEFPQSMFEEPEEEKPSELPEQQPVATPVQRDISKEVIKDLPKDRKISPIKIIDIDKITNPVIPEIDSPEEVKQDNKDTAKQIMNPEITPGGEQ